MFFVSASPTFFQLMLKLSKFDLGKNSEKTLFVSSKLNKLTPKYSGILLKTPMQKISPSSAFLGGGVHSKACWITA